MLGVRVWPPEKTYLGKFCSDSHNTIITLWPYCKLNERDKIGPVAWTTILLMDLVHIENIK